MPWGLPDFKQLHLSKWMVQTSFILFLLGNTLSLFFSSLVKPGPLWDEVIPPQTSVIEVYYKYSTSKGNGKKGENQGQWWMLQLQVMDVINSVVHSIWKKYGGLKRRGVACNVLIVTLRLRAAWQLLEDGEISWPQRAVGYI